MTAVASLTIGGHPLLFADLLTSSTPILGSRIALPLVDICYGPGVDAEKRPSGLRQKIAVVAKNVVIGWAGRFETASDVISEFREKCTHEDVDSRRAVEFFRRQPDSTWSEIELAGFIFDQIRNNVSSFGCNCSTINVSPYGEICFLGSGRSILEAFFRSGMNIPECVQDPKNLAIQAVGIGMAALGNFLTMEQFACESLESKFGGGFEIATLSYGEFVKLDSVLYVFWHASIDQHNQVIALAEFPFCAFRYQYIDDLLLIRGVGIGESDGKLGSDDRVFPIAPAYRYLTLSEKKAPPIPSLNAKWVCNFVQVSLAPQKMDIMTLVGHAKNPPWMEFSEANQPELKMSNGVRNDIMAGLVKRYGISSYSFD